MAQEDQPLDDAAKASAEFVGSGAKATGRGIAGGVKGGVEGGVPGAALGAAGGAASAVKPQHVLFALGAGVLVLALIFSALVGTLFNANKGGLQDTAGGLLCFIDGVSGGDGGGDGGGYDGPIPAGLNPKYIGKSGPDGIPKEAVPWIAAAVKATKEKVPAAFFAAMMGRESDFNPAAHAGDKNGGTYGLTQINQAEWNRLYGSSSWDEDKNNNGTRDIQDPEIHMQVSAKLADENYRKLKALRDKNPGANYTKNMDIWQHVAAAHNAGFAGSQRNPLPDVTQAYIAEIKKHMKMWAGDDMPDEASSKTEVDAPTAEDTEAMAGGSIDNLQILAAPGDDGEESDGDVVAPMLKNQYRITSGFGNRNVPGGSSNHKGIDFASKTPGQDATGLAIVAVADGKVHLAGASGTPSSGFGQRIVLEHKLGGETVSTLYGHMADAQKYIKPGQTVKKGQQISEVGHNGSSTAPHLHFEVWPGKYQQTAPVDPEPWLKDHGMTDLPGAKPGPGPGDGGGGGGGGAENMGCEMPDDNGSGGDGDTGDPGDPGGGDGGDSTDVGKKILKYAKAELGQPYRYGAGDQNGPGPGGTWDCSGLTTYAVYQGTNKDTLIPRNAAGQEAEKKKLKTIKKGELKPGDIVTMRKKGASGAHHTGLYWGNDQIIHAPSTGDVVKISKMSAWKNETLTFKKVPGNE